MSDKAIKWTVITVTAVICLIAIIYGIVRINEIESNHGWGNSYEANYDSDNKHYDSDDYKNDMNDWYADQANGKDYNYDDGGSYYCMGKNNTCSRKTNNAYDLYCSSCDPDGDNIEG